MTPAPAPRVKLGSWAEAQAFGCGRDCAAEGMSLEDSRYRFHSLFTRKSIARAFDGGWEAESAQRAIVARELARNANPYREPTAERAAVLRALRYGDAEMQLYDGRVTADEWEWYSWEWRNSAPRFSSLAQAYEAAPAAREGQVRA